MDSITSRNFERWDEECPQVVVCSCPETKTPLGKQQCRNIDVNYTLSKLRNLISDPVTCDDVPRISRFLYDYLHVVGNHMQDLPVVMQILEHLAWNARIETDYQPHLDRMLSLCALPPLLRKTSEYFVSTHIMEQYFTMLGYLMAILPTQREILMVNDALHNLLRRNRAANIAAVKWDYCHRCMENSRLPIIVTELIEASYADVYPKMLELAFFLISFSETCCYKMLKEGILNSILIRMDLPYATQARCESPPMFPLEGKAYKDETMVLIMNVLWALMNSILPPKSFPEKMDSVSAPLQCAMWGLAYSLLRQTHNAQHNRKSLNFRNEIAGFILAGLIAIPNWRIVESGLAKIVIDILVSTGDAIAVIWTTNVKFDNSYEDLLFKKILLLTVAKMTEIRACIHIMEVAGVMKTILHFMNPRVCLHESNTAWTNDEFWYLSSYALYTLGELAPKLPKEYIKYNGTVRLMVMIEWGIKEEINIQIAFYCVKTICQLATKGNPLLLANLRRDGMLHLVLKFIDCVMAIDVLTIQYQRILTLLLMVAEALMKHDRVLQMTKGVHSIKIVKSIFSRFVDCKNNEFKLDQRLLLGVGSYAWECIVWCQPVLESFVEDGGVYLILDVIQDTTYRVQCLLLALLTDMADGTFCGPYLCTWRGKDKTIGLVSLLATIWREEEMRIGVKIHSDGSLEDAELPHMGTKQWLETYRSPLSSHMSPAMNDMIGSVRSKVYSIRKILEREGERYELVKERYKILLDQLPVYDRVCMCGADLYLRVKIGQVWMEVNKFLQQTGVIPVGVDGEVLYLMRQRYMAWGLCIEERQKKILLTGKKVEHNKEKQELRILRDAQLSPALEALHMIEYIRRTTDRSYRLKLKDLQRAQINANLPFPPGTSQHHTTFQDRINVTAVLGQHHTVYQNREIDKKLDELSDIRSVSPMNSDTFGDEFVRSISSNVSIVTDDPCTQTVHETHK